MNKFDGVKVFSTTKIREREMLGESVTDWLRVNADKEIVDKVITQSSDNAFHCLTITLFYRFAASVAADTHADFDPREVWKDDLAAKKGAVYYGQEARRLKFDNEK